VSNYGQVKSRQKVSRRLGFWFLSLALAGCGTGTSRRQTDTPSNAPPKPLILIQKVENPTGPYLVGHLLPLTDAVSNFQSTRVKALLDGGADPNVREENATSWPPLALAMRGRAMTFEDEYNARLEMIRTLLAHGADANIRWCDSDRPQCNENTGVTPLMYAATLGNEEFSDLLLKNGADPSLRDWRGRTTADYWGVKTTIPPSWCLAPKLDKSPEPFAQRPILDDARWLVDPEYLEQLRIDGPAEMLEALRGNTDRSVEIVRDQRVCERAAVAYARHRVMEQSEPRARPVVPVAVVRAGPVWIVDDQADGGGRGIYDRSWRLLAWFEPPD
jgi:hypothetical protein